MTTDQRLQAESTGAPVAPVATDFSTRELAEEAIHKFLVLHRHLRQYALQMDHHGVRPREFSVLLFLLEHGPATVGEIQEYLYHSPSTTSAILAQMEEAGYVTRTRSEADNRVVIVALTNAGEAVARQGPVGGIPLLRRRLPTLAPPRLAAVNQALDDLMQLMDIPEAISDTISHISHAGKQAPGQTSKKESA